ncbi:beta-galactosidase [Lutibacter citreus]|uniref:beta-galactosidase n=1 Tax=Lutibacter citreus TaxID=2138210 RepID=UPI000DBE3D29|nr:beta-galactosidase [Lutibacter citreus]
MILFKTFKRGFVIAFLFASVIASAQSLDEQAKTKITELEKLIEKAEKKGIDVLKEKTTIRTAEMFLEFATWDEKNLDVNEDYFKKVKRYQKEAKEMAGNLANFERNDVILMLNEATDYLKLLLSKKVFRKSAPHVDWTKVKVEGDQLTYKNKPVFLADYTWKPNSKKLTEYHGNQDGFFLTPSFVVKEDGTINPKRMKELTSKPDGSLGFIFMNHKGVPKWSKEKYGPNFSMREDTYTAYDIDNPGARDVQQKLLSGVVPHMAGKNYSQLGYMLCNEPHFYTQKTGEKLAWASGPVSKYTIEKFRVWLKNKHSSIGELNNLWETSFASFDNVSIEIPIDTSLRGTPKWFDWTLFNMYRVTEWYKFLKSEIVKYDPEAKVHLKIMPNLWTENQRVHGIDLETLTEMCGIIGNDSGAEHTRMWGPKYEWEEHYGFEWRELCMGYDFMKSVSPNKINFNSELHYLSTGRSRNLDLQPAYARATFWLAHTYGMTASQIWFWPRKEDGSVPKKAGKGYAGSNNQQPRVTNEVATTIIDLNTYSEEIMAMQRQRKPLRIFYSKTSAINKEKHMDDIYHLYEALNFEGTPLGFVSKDIINKQDNNKWDAVLVYKTPFVTTSELKAVQNYLDNGGTVIIDEISLKKSEYGKPLVELNGSKGKLIKLNSVSEIKTKALSILKDKNSLPEITISETNELGVKVCTWKAVKNSKGNYVISAVNLGKKETTLKIELNNTSKIICKDLIKGIEVSSNPTLKPNEVFFVEVTQLR